jgi:hypothetical protein
LFEARLVEVFTVTIWLSKPSPCNISLAILKEAEEQRVTKFLLSKQRVPRYWYKAYLRSCNNYIILSGILLQCSIAKSTSYALA